MKREISEENKARLREMAVEILGDKNRLAKAIAVHLRNGIEDFHWKYLSDSNMREINPKIRNAIYTFLVDLGDKVGKASVEDDANICFEYVIANTYEYLVNIGISHELSNEFYEEVLSHLYQSFNDISAGGMAMVGLENLYVPKYWEDCVYINSLYNDIKY